MYTVNTKNGDFYVFAFSESSDVAQDSDGAFYYTANAGQPGMSLALDTDGTPYIAGTGLRVIPGKTEIQLTARASANRIPPELLEVPGGLYPLHSAAFEVDEYRILSGWPVPVPSGDIRIECLVSASGDVLSDRGVPTSITTGADLRWVADTAFYDQTAGQWAAMQGNGALWQATPGHLPTLITDYEYRVGDERFVNMTALNFDSNTEDYMWANMDLLLGGVTGYTVIMVMNPNSIYGNDLNVVDNAIWSPQDTDGNWVMFSIRNQALYMTTETRWEQRGVDLGNALASTAPCYLALVVDRPQTALYAASGPSRVLVKSLPAGEAPVPLSTRFWLGNGPFEGTGTMDMALMDLGFYGKPLSKDEVVREITNLSTVYGGDT